MKSAPIPSSFFIKNRKKLCGFLAPGSVAMICSNDPKLRNGDQFYPFRQHSDFFYLTGIAQSESILILAPGYSDPSLQEILFIRKSTSRSLLWNGPELSPEEASILSGIGQVNWLEDLDAFMEKLVPAAKEFYACGSSANEKISASYPDIQPLSISPLMTRLRMVKEYEEIEEIKKACEVTRTAFLRVLDIVSPGLWEYEIEAEITAEFLRKGTEGHAYEPIVASGRNALVLHYVHNHCKCRSGELLLMDFGAEVNNYAADCSRTIPVSGQFTLRQRELYNAVLRVLRQAKQLMKPGIVMSDFHQMVGGIWEEEHIRLGLYTVDEARAQPTMEPLWKKYYMHGTSHSLGLDVHDPFDRTCKFKVGMVLTCEPAIYIPEEGVGIRLENDILITESEAVDLMEDIPVEADEIESMMQNSQ